MVFAPSPPTTSQRKGHLFCALRNIPLRQVQIGFQGFILCTLHCPEIALRIHVRGHFLCQLHVLCGILVLYRAGTWLSYVVDPRAFTELLAAYIGALPAVSVLVPMVSCPFCHPAWLDLNYTSSVVTFVSWLHFHGCASQFPFNCPFLQNVTRIYHWETGGITATHSVVSA